MYIKYHIPMEVQYRFDPVKNAKLKIERGVNFEDVIIAIEQGFLRDIRPHHRLEQYPDQEILVVEINHYIYLVPCQTQGEFLVMKTVYPSRKATAVYLRPQEYTDET